MVHRDGVGFFKGLILGMAGSEALEVLLFTGTANQMAQDGLWT
jgi:hypothetical protein